MRSGRAFWAGSGAAVVVEGDLFGVDAEAVGEGVLWGDVEQEAGVLDEAGMMVEGVGGFGVDVEEPELAGVLVEGLLEAIEDAAQDGGEEGVVEEEEDGGEGEGDGGGVGVESGERVAELPGRGEGAEVLPGDAGEGGIELEAEDVEEGVAAGEEEGATLAAAEVDKGEAGEGWEFQFWEFQIFGALVCGGGCGDLDGGFGEGEGAVEDGGRDGVVGGAPEGGAVEWQGLVGGGVELVAAQVAAGVDGVGGVEGMGDGGCAAG